jgi:ATP-binding cassette subfamily F protein 3
MWLEEYLASYPSTVVIVSHDRGFLDNVVTDIIQVKNKDLHYYKGNYSQFVKARDEQYIAQKRAYEAQQMQIKHIEDFITTYVMCVGQQFHYRQRGAGGQASHGPGFVCGG